VSTSEHTSFGALPADAFAELGEIVPRLEAALKTVVDYEKINYLMLMMVDPHVHFHIFPRYSGGREAKGIAITDHGWPGRPDLKSAVRLDERDMEALRDVLITRIS